MTSRKLLIFVSYFILCAVSWPTYAKQNRLLLCLAEEENRIHQVTSNGPIYFLNQEFINSVSSISDIDIKQKYLNDICNNKVFSPSVALLKSLLINGERIFDFSELDLTIPTDILKKSMTLYLLEKIPHFWFDYLAKLLSFSKNPKCFQEEIPEISQLQEKYKYIEEDEAPGRLIEDKVKIEKIFDKIKGLENIIKKCQPEIIETKNSK